MIDLRGDAVAQFNEHGYLVATQLVDHRHIDAFLRDVNLVVREQLDHFELPTREGDNVETLHDNLFTIHQFDPARYLATLGVFNKLKTLYELFLSDRIAGACRALGVVGVPLMHTLPIFHLLSQRLRIDGGYLGFEAHQDWSGLQTSLNAIVAWVPLHDIDRQRFPLEVFPGSHLDGVCHSLAPKSDYEIDAAWLAGKPRVQLEVRKGDAVFMSPFTIHRSAITPGDQLRIAASWRYEDALEGTFIERKFPFAQSRVVSHRLLFPEFPSTGQMKRLLK